MGQEEGEAPPRVPPPRICPLAAKREGDRVSWAQLQGHWVGVLLRFLGKGGGGRAPGLEAGVRRGGFRGK